MIRATNDQGDEFECLECSTRFKVWDWRLLYGEITCPFCATTDVPEGGPYDSEDLVQLQLL